MNSPNKELKYSFKDYNIRLSFGVHKIEWENIQSWSAYCLNQVPKQRTTF